MNPCWIVYYIINASNLFLWFISQLTVQIQLAWGAKAIDIQI